MSIPKKILIVMGTRPEAVKLAPLFEKMTSNGSAFNVSVCVTGQHRSMLDQVLKAFDIVPVADLDVMSPGQTLDMVMAKVVQRFSEVIRQAKPDLVVVQGDTTSAFAAGLASFYEKVPIAHVEAGLRTGNKHSPFPEEVNRRLISPLIDLHFAPTEQSRQNLLRENVAPGQIFVTGNTVVDALHSVTSRISSDCGLKNALAERYGFLDPKRRLILVTGHRRENFGAPLRNMCLALVDILLKEPGAEILFPVHLNPNVQTAVFQVLGEVPERVRARIHLTPPVEYLDFIYLMMRSHLIITDSGGVQEEAPSLQKPVLVTRENTERPEAVEAGTAVLVGTERELVVSTALRLLQNPAAYASMQRADNPYGDGKACDRICEILQATFTAAQTEREGVHEYIG